MTVLAFLTERASVKKVLEHLDLPATGPAVAKARCSTLISLPDSGTCEEHGDGFASLPFRRRATLAAG